MPLQRTSLPSICPGWETINELELRSKVYPTYTNADVPLCRDLGISRSQATPIRDSEVDLADAPRNFLSQVTSSTSFSSTCQVQPTSAQDFWLTTYPSLTLRTYAGTHGRAHKDNLSQLSYLDTVETHAIARRRICIKKVSTRSISTSP
jgi:hypothetical protein